MSLELSKTETANGSTAAADAFAVEMNLQGVLAELIEATQALVDGPAVVDVDEDPEIPNSRVFVVNIALSGSATEIAKLNDAWHDKLLDIATDNAGHFCLAIDIGTGGYRHDSPVRS